MRVFYLVLCLALIVSSLLYIKIFSNIPQYYKSLINEKFIKNDQVEQLLNMTSEVTANYNETEFDLSKTIEYSMNQVPERQRVLASVQREFYNLYGSLAAEVFCTQKIRIGNIGDGGKWTCNPWAIPQNSVIFSLGLNNLVDFDVALQELLHNSGRIYGFDNAEQYDTTKLAYAKINGVTMKATISKITDPESSRYTIDSLMNKFNISNIEIVKMDVEGSEYETLLPFLDLHTVCQIYIEIHGEAGEHMLLLRKISQHGYGLFSYEVNGYNMAACEYSFIHSSCIKKYGAIPLVNYLKF